MSSPPSNNSYELGPIRPPSEAASLLLRVTRNCPSNKCAFCAVYKGAKFSRRDEMEVIGDINTLLEADKSICKRLGLKKIERLSSEEVLVILNDAETSEEERRMALWYHNGGKNVFLQDADSLIIPAHRVAKILRHLYECFPSINRVTTYARSRTLVAKSSDQLNELRHAGLTRIHVGVESGSDDVLELIKKGCRAEHHIEGCKKAMEAGFEVCCYIMPGLGGKQFSHRHARETAAVLKAIEPHHVRLRTLWVDRESPLHEMQLTGDFQAVEEDETVREILTIVRDLRGINSRIVSDHDRNLLGEIEGHLTDDADYLEKACLDFLSLSKELRDAFVLARRAGHFRSLDLFLSSEESRRKFIQGAQELRIAGEGSLLRGMQLRLRRRSI